MLKHSLIRHAMVATGSLVLLLSLSQAQAAPVCKEIDIKSQCTLNSNCSWVNSYTTKKGNKISAYCRKKGGKKKSTNNKKTKTTQTVDTKKKNKQSKPKKDKVKQNTAKPSKAK